MAGSLRVLEKPILYKRRLLTCEQLLESKTLNRFFLQHIVTEDEKLVHYDKPIYRKSQDIVTELTRR